MTRSLPISGAMLAGVEARGRSHLMAAFLLSWNPEKYPWDTLRKDIARIRRKGFVTDRWFCGNRTDLPKGSEFFLIRLGPALKGLVGRGVTASAPFEDKHWEAEKRRKKIKALYVKVRFTDLNETPIIPWEELQQLPLSRFKWSSYASGVAIPELIVEELDRRWMARKTEREVAAPTGAGPDDLAQGRYRLDLETVEGGCRVTGLIDR